MIITTPCHTNYAHFVTWTINRQKFFIAGIITYTIDDLDLLHCPESCLYLSHPNHVATNIFINNAIHAGYHLIVTKHSHLYLNIKTLQSYLFQHNTLYDVWHQTLIFKRMNNIYSAVIVLYVYQRGVIRRLNRQHPLHTIALRQNPWPYYQGVLGLGGTLYTVLL